MKTLYHSTYVRSLAVRVTNAGLALGVSILLARLLGPEEYGRYGILLSFATILAIPLTAGLPKTMTRDIAAVRAHEDLGNVRVIIRLGTKTFFGLIPIILVIAFSLFLAGYEVAGFSFGVLLSATLAPIASADANRLAIMRGLGSAVRSQIPDMLVRPLGTMIIVVTLLLTVGNASAITGIVAYSLAVVFGFVIGSIMVRNDLKEIPVVAPKKDANVRRFLGSILTMSLLGSAGTLTGNIDMLLLDRLATYEIAGQYKVALAGLAVVVLGGNAVSAVAFTRLAEAIPSGDKKVIAALSDQALRWSVAFTVTVTLLAFVLGRRVILVLYGPEYSEAWNILMILALGFCVAFCFGQAPEIASLSGAQVPAALSILLGIAITVVVAYFSVPSLGVLGIALGSMVGTIIRYVAISIVIRVKLGVDLTMIGLLTRVLKRRAVSQ